MFSQLCQYPKLRFSHHSEPFCKPLSNSRIPLSNYNSRIGLCNLRYYSRGHRGHNNDEESKLDKKVFKSWDSDVSDSMMNPNDKFRKVGTLEEIPKHVFTRWPKEERKALDLKLNLQESPFEVSEKDDHYYYKGVKVPQHLDHWIESPGGIKKQRDNKLLVKMEKMRAMASKRMKMKMKGNQSDADLLDRKKVTTRMLRFNNMIQEILNRNLEDLHSLLSAKKVGKRHVSLSIVEALDKSMLQIDRIEVTKDLRHAKAYWKCIEGHEMTVERNLKRLTQALRHQLAAEAHMKYVPELHLVREKTNIRQVAAKEAINKVQDELLVHMNWENKETIPPMILSSDMPSKLDVVLEKKERKEDIFKNKKKW